ncbi:MAG TPA: hypothetical protein VLA44_00930 [Clostridia bacterium]|nr:hypothetical protein [Clostridia bacterium]
MPDDRTLAAILLAIGPIVGAVAASHPSLYRVWGADRDEHLRIVGSHRLAWTMLNAGFFLATVSTASGLAVLAAVLSDDPARGAALGALAVAYAVGGSAWCVVVAVRARTTPALADSVAGAATAGTATAGPAELLLGSALSGLFGAFLLTAGAAVVGVGLTLAVAGGIALPVALVAAGLAGLVIASYLVTGDAVPAVLYLPTILIGIALLAGWT